MTRTKSARLGLFLVVLASFAAQSARAQSIHLPPHERAVLKNGLTVLLLEKHGVPIISFYGVLKAGAAADPVGQEGLAAITAGLLRKGTKTRTNKRTTKFIVRTRKGKAQG